jgi:broad specificity phosphatase PhoE/ketosteroid isomerase-like protein
VMHMRNMRLNSAMTARSILLLLSAPAVITAQTARITPTAGATTIVLVRHAEKSTDDPRDPSLSPAGEARAHALATLLGGAAITDIYATQYKRTRQTAEPLATGRGIAITERPVTAANTPTYAHDLAQEILTRSRGKNLLVVGHSNTVPEIVKALGGVTVPPIADAEYDRVFVVVVPESGTPRVTQGHYGAPCCAAGPQGMSPSSDEIQVRAAMASFLDALNALNALDVARMDAAFTDDITAFVPTAQADEAVGRPAVTAIFRAFADRLRPTTPRLNIVPEDEQVEVSPTLAVVTFQVHEHNPDVTRRRTAVFRRVGDRWLISHMHASDIAAK